MKATIRDVAAKAQVSFQLVSAVLGNKSYAHASAATREKIMNAARELGYQPNICARILQGGKSKVIGVLVDSRAPEAIFTLLAELEQAAAARNYRILIAESHDEPEKLFDSYISLKQNQVDGIISLANDYPGNLYHLEKELQQEKNLVFVRNVREEGCAWVDVDMADAVKTAIIHLQSQGYENIAFLCWQIPQEADRFSYSVKERIAGFRELLPDGESFLLPVRMGDVDELAIEVRKLVESGFYGRKVDAVIAVNDYWGAMLIRELIRAGKHVPEDFGVIGCDDRPICRCIEPELTTLTYDRSTLARKAVDMLLGLINAEENIEKSNIVKTKLIVRKSSNRQI